MASKHSSLITRFASRFDRGIPYTQEWFRQRNVDDIATAGPNSYGRPLIHRQGSVTLTIGDYCSIAEEVEIFLGDNHRVDWVTTYPFSSLMNWPNANTIPGHPISKGPVWIGSDVWIGRGAVILSGLSIGHGAVVGARSVVTKNVSPYTIVAGNPARVVRSRFDQKTVNELVNISWWKWDRQRIEQAIPYLLDSDIDKFIQFANKISEH